MPLENENITCKNCNQVTSPNSKFCSNCGIELYDSSTNIDDVIISTGDINREYDIIRPIHYFHNSLMNKEVFGEKNINFDDIIDSIIQILKDETLESDGNGIIHLRIDFEQLQLAGTQYFVYGTMVKIIK